MKNDLIVSIDAGTTGITVVVYDRELCVQRRVYREIACFYPREGWVEQDANEIWETTRQLVRECVGSDGDRVAAVGITNQRETVVAFDGETCEPLARAIVWQCRRTTERCEALKASGVEERVRSKTGLLLDPYFSGTKMRWLLDNDGAVGQAGESLRMGTVDAWLVHQLTGGAVFATDHTNASRTLLYDLDEGAWSDELLEIFGVERGVLPEVRRSVGSFGETTVEAVGFQAPILSVIGDQQAALFGQGCVSGGDVKCTYGTGAFLLMKTDGRPMLQGPGLLATAAVNADGGRGFAVEGAVFVAGAVVQWLRDELGLIEDAAETEPLARSVTDTAGVQLVPAFTGLGAPHWNPNARGIMTGLTRGATKAHIVRAALEGIAQQVEDLLEAFRHEGSIRQMAVDGGASANDFLLEFQSGLSNIEIHRGTDLESTVRGAARGALLGLGEGINQPTDSQQVFPPDMPSETRAALREAWGDAVRRTS